MYHITGVPAWRKGVVALTFDLLPQKSRILEIMFKRAWPTDRQTNRLPNKHSVLSHGYSQHGGMRSNSSTMKIFRGSRGRKYCTYFFIRFSTRINNTQTPNTRQITKIESIMCCTKWMSCYWDSFHQCAGLALDWPAWGFERDMACWTVGTLGVSS